MGFLRAGKRAAIGLGAILGLMPAASPAWACAPSFFAPPLTLSERFAEGAWLAEGVAIGFEGRATGYIHGDPETGRPMRRVLIKPERALWGSPPTVAGIRQWDEEFPNYWICMRYEPSFCADAKQGDRLLILGRSDGRGGTESLECLPQTPQDPEAAAKAEAFRGFAAGAQERASTLRAEAEAAKSGSEGYAAAMALGEALAEYGDHAATDVAFRAAVELDPERPDAWLRLARHRLDSGDLQRLSPLEEDLKAGLSALDEYLGRFGEHPRLRRAREDLALALGQAPDLARVDLRGVATTSPEGAGAIVLRGAPPGLDASRSRAAFDAAQAELRGARFREADLEGGDFTGADLRGADLRDVKALGVSFRGANLRGADLTYARLTGADLSEADLRGALLVFADLRGTDLRGANLGEAFLPGAHLFGARLAGADLKLRDPENPMIDLSGAFYDCATLLPEGLTRGLIPLERVCGEEERIADLSGLDTLDDSPDSILVLEDLDLRGADVSNAGRTGRLEARIAGADLRGANFTGSRVYLFWGAGPRGRAKLAGVDFRDAELVLNLPGADLRGADFRGAHVAGLKKGYDLRETKFSGATLDFALAGYTAPSDLAALMEAGADFSGARLLCVASARAEERKLWADLAAKIKTAGLRPSPACAEALSASAAP